MELTDRARNILEGLLLGDGRLELPEGKNVNAHFTIGLVNGRGKHKLATADIDSFLRVVKNSLVGEGLEIPDTYPAIYSSISHGKPYKACFLQTLGLPILTNEYHRWYIDGIKEVPENIDLNPEKIAYWFITDGCTRVYGNSVLVDFSTYSYSMKSILILQRELEPFGIYTYRCINKEVVTGSGVRLFVYSWCDNKFMDMVRPYIIYPYDYKIAYKRSEDHVRPNR